MDIVSQLSNALADHLAAAARWSVALRLGGRLRAGILWRPDVAVTSEQTFHAPGAASVVLPGGDIEATLAGRDPGINVAVFRLAAPLPGVLPAFAAAPRPGALALIVGADARGAPTARLAMVHETGPEWHSQAGGLISSLIRLDARLGADEGGPVLDHTGALLGMSTAGPGHRVLVIPAATIERAIDRLLTHGRMPRGWLGVALEGVALPESRGAMVMRLVPDAPAARAGVLLGDILLDLDGAAFGGRRARIASLAPGRTVPLRLIRGGEARTIMVTIGDYPMAARE